MTANAWHRRRAHYGSYEFLLAQNGLDGKPWVPASTLFNAQGRPSKLPRGGARSHVGIPLGSTALHARALRAARFAAIRILQSLTKPCARSGLP